MEAVTLDREEWVAVARELETAYRESAPPGLRARIANLLSRVPAEWGSGACTLDLDPGAAEVVRGIVRRGRALPEQPGLVRSQGEAVAEAEEILRVHHLSGTPARYRVEHRTADGVVVVGRTSAVDARQAELSQHAARLMAAGATGELVLLDEETGEELARRHLRPDLAPDDGEGDAG